MLKRTLTGAVITCVVYLAVALSHIPGVLLCGSALLSAFSVYEIYNVSGIGKNRALLWSSLSLAVILSVIPLKHFPVYLSLVFLFSLGLFVWMMVRQSQIRGLNTGLSILVAFLVVILFRSVPALRKLPYGLHYLASSITLCFATDVAAYLIGSQFGQHKLLPTISPNKTREGALAGIGGAVLVICLFCYMLERNQGIRVHWMMALVYAVTASIVGQFGDLAMSAVKRVCGVKDFGHLLPGHGGILDRFDSHVFCIPYTFLFCTLTGGFWC